MPAQDLVAGYWLWQVDSMEEATLAVSAKQHDWVKRCPNPMPGDSDIKIRPIIDEKEFEALITELSK